MCPSTRVTTTAGVYLEHSREPGSRSSRLQLDLVASCGCVLHASKSSHNGTQKTWFALPMTNFWVTRMCALHVSAPWTMATVGLSFSPTYIQGELSLTYASEHSVDPVLDEQSPA